VANGSTWYDRTNYYETLPAHHLELGLWLEADRMGFLLPAITEKNLETQREVVMNERRQRVENQPYGRAGERLHELLYPADHPYHWPVIGYMEDIAAAPLAEVREFFSTYYVPNNAVLTVAGDIEPARALARIEAWFGDLPAGPPVPPVTVPEVPRRGELRAVLEDDVRLPRVYLGHRAPGYGHPLWYASDLLALVLAGGKSSPLYRDLVYERQIAQDVAAHVAPYEEVATVIAVATARPGVPPEALEEALNAHLARAAAGPPDPEDLTRARNRALTEVYAGLQKLETRADLFSQCTTYFDDPGGIGREADRYLAVDDDDLVAAARQCWTPEDRAVVTVVPRGPRARD
jgi:zinc protease